MTTSFAKRDSIFSKFDDENRIAYGWAIVSEDNGKPYYDLHGDWIPMAPIIKASIDFMKSSRASDDMHQETKTGEVVFCAPVTDATLVDPAHPSRKGLWIGVQINDEKVYEKTKAGDRRGFSIGGFLDEAEYVGKAKTKGYESNSGTVAGESLQKYDRMHVEQLAKGNKPKRIFRSFRLGFISTVDYPAQEGALISIVKNAPKEAVVWMRKGLVFTSEDDGHQHLVDTTCFREDGRGWTCSASQLTKNGSYDYHSHDMIVDGADGTITIGANAGHSHTVEAKGALPPPKESAVDEVTATVEIAAKAPPFVADEKKDEDEDEETDSSSEKKPKKKPYAAADKSARSGSEHNPLVPGSDLALGLLAKDKENTMPTEKEIELQKSLDLAIARAERAEKVAELSPAQKTYFGKLSPQGQTAFLAKSAIERDTELKAQVEYVSPVTGDTYYKFDDERVVKNARRADDAEKREAEQTAIAKRATFAKKAGEVMKKAYPGTDDVHTEIVAAIEGIADEGVRKAAFEAITAGATALIAKSRTNGHGANPGGGLTPTGDGNSAGDPNGTSIEKARVDLRASVEAYQKANNIGSYEVAFLEATQKDAKTRDLYNAVQEMGPN